MKRVAIAVLLLVLLGVAACGEDPSEPVDLALDLQRAIDARDDVSYANTLAAIRERRPLADADLDRMALAMHAEWCDDLAWPGPYYPSATAILEGTDEPLSWFLKGFRIIEWRSENGMVPGARQTPPYLRVNDRLLTALRTLLYSEELPMAHDTPVPVPWDAALLLGYLRPEDRESVVDDLIECTLHQDSDVRGQCRYALACMGTRAVPKLAARLRSAPSPWHAGQIAWVLSVIGLGARGAHAELVALLTNENSRARRYSAVALLKVDRAHPSAREVLLQELINEKLSGWQRSFVGYAITDLLGLVEVLPRLREILKRPDLDGISQDQVRNTIAHLERLQQKDSEK